MRRQLSPALLLGLALAALQACGPSTPATSLVDADTPVEALDAMEPGTDASSPLVLDAAAPPDAAMPQADAGEPADAEESPDARLVEADAELAGPDAAQPADAGQADSGSPGPDASTTPDASTPADASSGVCSGAYPAHVGADSYTAIESLREAALRAQLESRVKTGHTSLGYDGAKTALFSNSGIDVHGGKVECVYTGDLFNPSQLDGTNGFNTEHSWPQSEFGSEASVAKGDMHHLFPTEKKINSCRNNFSYGETDSPDANCSRAGSERGTSVSSGALVFEVRPQKRGDMARAHFYFAVRYKMAIPAAEEAVLRCWHEQDPPDAEEQARNDAIEAKQHNRNPFVDRPEFVGYISNF